MDLSKIRILILAGGKGTRLSSVVPNLPKPMAPVAGRPFLTYLVDRIVKAGLTQITFLTGHKADLIRTYFGKGPYKNLHFSFSFETEPLGTGGAIRAAVRNSSEQSYLIFNGDTFFDIDLLRFINRRAVLGLHAMALAEQPDCSRYGQVKLNPAGVVQEFLEKGSGSGPGLINAGIYFLDRSIESFIPDGFCSLEERVLPFLVSKRLMTGLEMGSRFIDIGIPEDYEKAQTLIPEWLR
jgi:D-glycero-alpha-D-manno-heptose 1-phosphate guanylyltransferase